MKNYILTTALLLSSAVAANAQTHFLSNIETDSQDIYYEHFYNSQLQLDSTSYHILQSDGTIGYFANKYQYDDKGNIVKTKIYIKPEGGSEYIYSQYVEYSYDEENKIQERANYEKFGSGAGNFLLGGVYSYTYNNDGKLIERNLYTDKEKTERFDTTSYEYDSNGRLAKEATYLLFMGMNTFSSGTKYKYNEDGHISEKISFVITEDGQEVDINGFKYVYDSDGNISECSMWDTDVKNIKQKEVYTYDMSLKKEDVVLPIDRETDYTIPLNSAYAIKTDELYASRGGSMQLYDTYNYYYTPIKNGVRTIMTTEPVHAFCTGNGNTLVLNMAKPATVRIYDMNGRMMQKTDYFPGNGIDISRLQNGIYCIVTPGGTAKFKK